MSLEPHRNPPSFDHIKKKQRATTVLHRQPLKKPAQQRVKNGVSILQVSKPCPVFSSRSRRLRSNIAEQKQMAASLESQLQEKLASQSGEVKALAEEAAALRNELKAAVEETQVLHMLCVCVFHYY